MLRDPSLIPLSQQHHNGLALCVLTNRSLSSDRSAENVTRLGLRVVDRYEIELSNHFQIEERVLFPGVERELGPHGMIPGLVAEHRAMEAIVERLRTRPSAEGLEEFCDLLRSHIRREENEFFQDIQQRMPHEALAALGTEIDRQAVRAAMCEIRALP